MNEEGKEAIKELKHYANITPHWKLKEYTFSEVDNYIKTTLNYINKLQKVIDLMAEELTEITGSCPLDRYDWENKKCDNCTNTYKECFIDYYTKKAEEEK